MCAVEIEPHTVGPIAAIQHVAGVFGRRFRKATPVGMPQHWTRFNILQDCSGSMDRERVSPENRSIDIQVVLVLKQFPKGL